MLDIMKRAAALLCLTLLMGFAAAPQATGNTKASLTVVGQTFVLTQPGGKTLTSKELVGAIFDMRTPEGMPVTARIDSVKPSKEQSYVLLHAFSIKDATGKWAPMCEKDAYGRSAGFPVAGTWNGSRFVADKSKWFITCTSGSQGKCILFGYDPWKKGPHGENLIPYYEACQHMVRADYDGKGAPHTKNGTLINIWDHIGIQFMDRDVAAKFEAGWGPAGAVCVAKTRWSDLLTLAALRKSSPRLAGPCDEKIAAKKGAVLFNQSK